MNKYLPLFVVVQYVYWTGTHVDGACATTSWEPADFNTITDFTDADTGTGYLMETVEYHVIDTCTCGVLSKWKFRAKASNDAVQVQFQVWERTDSLIYTLKGENYFTVPGLDSDQTIEFAVPPRHRITVAGGYLLGWYTKENNAIAYNNNSVDLPDGLLKEVGMTDLTSGDTYNWHSGTVTLLENTAYAIGATVTDNTAPGFTNLPRDAIIYRTTSIPTFLYTVEADDLDPDDVSSLVITGEVDPTSPFTYNSDTQELFLTSEPELGSYTLTFTVTDQCGLSSTGIFTVTVNNWEPEITNLPGFATIPEETTAETLLYTVTISDDDDTSHIPSFNVDPSTTDITQKPDGFGNSQIAIYSQEGAGYVYNDNQLFTADLTITDGTVTADVGYFLLYITKNDPPIITNLNNAEKAYASYLTSTTGDAIYEVTATDAENDELTFTLQVCACPFQISGGGVLTVTEDLKAKYQTDYVTGYDLVITVNDSFTTHADKTLTVLIQDINDKPVISNLPLDHALVVHENTALGTTIFSVLYNDLDTTDTHTVLATFAPTSGTDYFALNVTTGVLTTANNVIDYESMSDLSYTLNITVSDGEDSDSSTLGIDIGGVNEAPSFHQTRYTLEPPEEGTALLSAGDPNFQVDDPDLLLPANNEGHFYTWDCGVYSRYFLMNRDTGNITFASTFDLDTSTVTGAYDCTVTVTDKRGLTATTTLEVEIHDVNDNAPVFTQSTDYVFFAVPTLGNDRFIGQVSATDADKSSAYSTIYYSIIESPFDKGYLLINEYGNIYVNETWEKPEFDYGNIYELVIQAGNAVDETGTRQIANATVSLVLPATTTTTTTTTERSVAFAGDTRNAAWVTVLAALCLMLLVAVCSLMVAYTTRTKRYRWCIPVCRRWLLNLTHVTDRIKRKRYRDILLRDFEETSSEEESDDETADDKADDTTNVLSLQDETANDEMDMQPYARPPFKEDVASAPRPLTEL